MKPDGHIALFVKSLRYVSLEAAADRHIGKLFILYNNNNNNNNNNKCILIILIYSACFVCVLRLLLRGSYGRSSYIICKLLFLHIVLTG